MKNIGQKIFVSVSSIIIIAILGFSYNKYGDVNGAISQTNTNTKTIINNDSCHIAKNKVQNTLIIENRSLIRVEKNRSVKRDSIIIEALTSIATEIRTIRRQNRLIFKHNKRAAEEWEQFNLLMSDK